MPFSLWVCDVEGLGFQAAELQHLASLLFDFLQMLEFALQGPGELSPSPILGQSLYSLHLA